MPDPEGRMNILIVDNEASSLQNLEQILEKMVQEAKIKKADRADMALLLCREQEFDIVFLDIHMPGNDGLELIKEIRQVCPSLLRPYGH